MDDKQKRIHARILDHGLTQTWLIRQLRLRGIDTDKSTVSSALMGTRKGAKAESIVDTADLILSDYEAKMGKYA